MKQSTAVKALNGRRTGLVASVNDSGSAPRRGFGDSVMLPAEQEGHRSGRDESNNVVARAVIGKAVLVS